MFYYKKIKEEKNTGLISSSCEQPESESLIEITEMEFKAIQEELKPAPHIPTIDDLRRAEFPNEHDLIVALWELVVENRPESAEALQIKRLIVKERIPKT